MFGWLKKAKEKINPPDMFDRIKVYLTENAPDILENYELHYYPSEILNSRVDSDDISCFTINGKDYTVPWNRHEKPTDLGIPLISNTYQRNTASVNKCGEKTLQIQIKEESDGSGENKEKH